MNLLEVKIMRITVDEKIQQRASLNDEYIVELSKEIADGAVLPPLDVYDIDGDLLLTDGFHRLQAFIEAGVDTVEAKIYKGTERDATLHAVGANADHGLRRTNADKRKAVTTLLEDEEWRKLSDGEIARICRVSQPFVSKVRNELTQNGFECESMRKGADGRVLNTSNIGVRPQAEESEDSRTIKESGSPGSEAETTNTDEEDRTQTSEEDDAGNQAEPDSNAELEENETSSDQNEEGNSGYDGNYVDGADESTSTLSDEEDPIPDSSSEEQTARVKDEDPETESRDDSSSEEATEDAGDTNSSPESEADEFQSSSINLSHLSEVLTLKAKIAELEKAILEKDQQIEELETENVELQRIIQEFKAQLQDSDDFGEPTVELSNSAIY